MKILVLILFMTTVFSAYAEKGQGEIRITRDGVTTVYKVGRPTSTASKTPTPVPTMCQQPAAIKEVKEFASGVYSKLKKNLTPKNGTIQIDCKDELELLKKATPKGCDRFVDCGMKSLYSVWKKGSFPVNDEFTQAQCLFYEKTVKTQKCENALAEFKKNNQFFSKKIIDWCGLSL